MVYKIALAKSLSQIPRYTISSMSGLFSVNPTNGSLTIPQPIAVFYSLKTVSANPAK